MEKIHGETRIVLRNPISGNILKDITSENTFQSSVIARGLRNLGAANACYLNNNNVRETELWKEMVGGLFLFRDAITEGKHYMPAGNKMTGNGSYNIVNNSDPVELGSWNNNESSATASAITQVYDFTTSQGNGTIGSVCLTSRWGGYFGYGNASEKVSQLNVMTLSVRQDLMTCNPREGQDTGNRCVVGNYGYKTEWNSSNKTLTIYKYKIPVTVSSVFDWMLVSTKVIDCSELDYTYAAYGDGCSPSCVFDQTKIMFTGIYEYRMAPNATCHYWVYDTSTETLSQETFTNTSANDVAFHVSSSIARGILFVRRYGGVYGSLFNASTGVHIKDVIITENPYWHNNDGRISEFPEGLVCIPNARYANMINVGIYDPVNDTYYPTNAAKDTGYAWQSYNYNAETDTLQYGKRYDYIAFNNPLYLATINNLNSPVTKTSAQTMKVTYSLTKE